MKIAFFWTPVFAADILSGILAFSEIEVFLVVSQPDMPVGRKQELFKTPVKQVALEKGIPVLQPESLKSDLALKTGLRSLNLDFIVVVAYGKIIPKYILDIPKYGCINIHGSILPKYRWASPVQECLKNGDTETWLTTMYMSKAMDEGDILKIAKFQVDKDDNTEDIFQKFVHIGPDLLRKTLQNIISGELHWTPQDHSQATYCSKISKEQGEIFFQKQTAQEIYNLFRAYTPWPGIYTYFEGKRFVIEKCCFSDIWDFEKNYWWALLIWNCIKINKQNYWIICADNRFLVITQVKLEGKNSMDMQSFVNGNKRVLDTLFS